MTVDGNPVDFRCRLLQDSVYTDFMIRENLLQPGSACTIRIHRG
jgi:hypothetical protein